MAAQTDALNVQVTDENEEEESLNLAIDRDRIRVVSQMIQDKTVMQLTYKIAGTLSWLMSSS